MAAPFLCVAFVWGGCTDSPDLATPVPGAAVSVVFPEPVAEPFGYSETRTVAVKIEGAAETEVSAPKGWQAEARGESVEVVSPSSDTPGLELSGYVTVTVRNESGTERSASLRVFIGEWEPYVEFTDKGPVIFSRGETRSLEVIARDVADAEVEVPAGWTAEWDGSAVSVTAPQGNEASFEDGGSVVLRAYSESRTYSWETSAAVELSDDLSVNLNLGDTYANCYVVSTPATDFYLDATVMGNGEAGLSEGLKAKLAEHGNDVASAQLPAGAQAMLLWESEKGLVSNVRLSSGGSRLSFRTADTFTPGNASVATVDGNGNIIWSWHIWITDRPAEQTYSNGKIMMDRDLGAVSAVPADYGAVGLMYEWGRKDPFPAGCALVSGNADKAEDTEVFVHDNSRKMSTHADYPFRVVYTNAEVGTIEYAVQHPTDYICTVAMTGGGDWYYGSSGMWESDRNPYLWGNPEGCVLEGDGGYRRGEKSVYDPCPPGWRVPDADTYAVFCTRGSSGGKYEDGVYNIHGTPEDYRVAADYRGYAGGSWIVGLNFVYDEAGSYSWFPAVGSRVSESGRLNGSGMNVFQWTNSPYRDSPRHSYYLWGSKTYLYPMRDGGDRAYGYSVRCMKE